MNVIDLFCGAGGLSYGFEQAGFKTVLGVDINPFALETFNKNHNNSKTLCGDLTSDSFKDEIIKHLKGLKITGILGGPPCQGFSLKGKKLGLNDNRNYLFQEYLKIVKRIDPDFIVMENVKALISTAGGYFFNETENQLTKLGFSVQAKILNAKEFGVPQSRERVFIIGTKYKSFDFSMMTSENTITVSDAISDLHFLESGEGCFKQEYKITPQSTFQKDMRKNSDSLFNHQATRHSTTAINKLKMIRPEGNKNDLPLELHGNQKFSTTWSRLKWMQVSPTIDTRFDTPSNGCNSHPELHRAITPREAARLQSFPDNFIFYGKKTEVCKQIGNAVPPKLAYSIAKVLYNLYKK